MQTILPINLRQRRTFSEVLRTVFTFARTNFKPLFTCLMIIPGPLLVCGSVFWGLSFGSVFGVHSVSLAGGQGTSLLYLFYAQMLSVVTGLTLLTAVVNAFIVLYEEQDGRAPTVGQVWQRTKKILPGTIGLSFVWSLFVGIASFFFLLPGIYVGVALSLIFVIRAKENIGVLDTISRSFSLIKGYWWQTLGILVIMYVITILASYAFVIPPIFIDIFIQLDSANTDAPLFLLIIINTLLAISLLVYLLLSSLLIVALALQYYNIVERREAVGLVARIDDMAHPGQATSDTDDSLPAV